MTATRFEAFTVVFARNGVVYRDVCDWPNREGAAFKAKQLRRIFANVKVVPLGKAVNLPTVA